MFLAGLSILVVFAKEDKSSSDKDVVIKHVEPAPGNDERFRDVWVDQELSGKDTIVFDGQ